MRKIILLSGIMFMCLQSIAQYNFYYGNIHSHTEYSDGNKDSVASGVNNPGESFAYAKGSYHIDFWGISEHNHFTATNNPGMLLSRYAQGLYQADTANQNGTFVAMYGMEFGTISQGGHIVIYNSPGLIGWETIASNPNYNTYCPLNNFPVLWNIVNSIPNAFCTMAHPQLNDYGNILDGAAFNTSADSCIVGTAIRSGSAFSTTTDYTDFPALSYETEYKKALSKGYHVSPSIDHDNHYTTFGRTNKTRTVVLSNALNRDSIIDAYKHRRFYASDDWNAQVNYQLNGNYMGSIINTTSNSNINIVVTDADVAETVSSIAVYYGIPGSGLFPTILTSNTLSNSLNYTHVTADNSTYYYYAKIIQSDGDIIWTAPIWIYRTPIILPYRIVSFTAQTINDNIALDWKLTHNELIDEITLEHSKNGTTFETIFTTSAECCDTLEKNYSYTDVNPTDGIHFYRLKLKDIEGKIQYSSTQSAIIEGKKQLYNLYPNPASNQLNLAYQANTETRAIVKIYNADGREILFQNCQLYTGENKLMIDITSLAKGIYYIVLQKQDVRLVDTQFIKL